MRRTALAFLASVGLHATLLAGALYVPAGLAFAPKVYLVPFSVEEVQELPLRPPAKARKSRVRSDAAPARRRSRPGSDEVPGAQNLARAKGPAAAPAAEEVAKESEERRRGDVRAYGPEGSRVVAVLRLDRLRAAPDARTYITAVDDVLRLLPDRRRLLEETKLDLYRDFDVLLVATPNPFDDTMTFLAARHRLEEEALRVALNRGAEAGGRAIEWRKQRGRYVGVRKGSGGGGAAERDERVFLLLDPNLFVIASPAYASLLLDGAGSADGGATQTDGGATQTDGGATQTDGGEEARDRDWRSLVARIDAEDGAIPENAVFVLTATNLLRPGVADVATGTGTGIGDGPRAPPLSLAPPDQISILIGTVPTPHLEVRAEFGRESDARSYEARWPGWKLSLLANPLVLFARAGPLVSRTELQRDGSTITLHTTATKEEILRLLRMVASLTPSDDSRVPARGASLRSRDTERP